MVEYTDPNGELSETLLTSCAQCHKFMTGNGDWREVTSELYKAITKDWTKTESDSGTKLPFLSHSYCPKCYELQLEDIRRTKEAMELTARVEERRRLG